MSTTQVAVVQIRRPFNFESPAQGEVFAALLLVVDPTVTSEEKLLLAGQLVRQGCRYAVCAGLDSSTWDDAIDHAGVIADLEDAPSFGFVMTTWHEGEALDDVVEFFFTHAMIDDAEPIHRLAILIGEDEIRLRELQEAVWPT
jgi:hypothetical protein